MNLEDANMMKSNSKLSIILPVFNGEKYIQNTIKNIMNSSYKNLELLLIDDGSTDESYEICKECAAMNDKIKFFHKTNGGIAEARNYGLDHVTGDYVAFCDQDDEIDIDMYQKMMDRILTHNSQAVLCGSYRKKKNGKKILYERFCDKTYNEEQIRNELFLPMMFRGFEVYTNDEIVIYPTIWKCIIKRELIMEEHLRFSSFVSHEDDLIMMIQIFLKADRISTLSDILYCWNTNVESETYHCRKKYHDNLEAKQRQLSNYIINEFEEGGIQHKIISKYMYVLQCHNVLAIMDNLATSNKEKLFTKIRVLKKNPSVIYIQMTGDIVKPAKGFIRNRIIIPLVTRKHIVIAYLLNNCIDRIRFWVEKYYIAEKIERLLKRR